MSTTAEERPDDRTSEEDAATGDEAAIEDETEAAEEPPETTVTVRCTGHVRTELDGTYEFEYTFTGNTLREFLDDLFEDYPELQELLIAETEADATHSGWAPTPEELPGTWTKNPVGEQTIAYARILVNGRFNENERGFDTELEEGDRVALVYPFMFCC
ncbi:MULTISPECIES: MoaD/ThiS family protein [Halorubrum]|uniref:Pterin cluster protein n=1 Tax=Halorubrum halodurans TaxID=1383851 RepID=A0A256ILA7_9EURY|nr:MULTISPECIES: MoaD/ThiS family protein [Halorubrum]OYR56932.1 pterin cluster protein [Halorubrum halodurans]